MARACSLLAVLLGSACGEPTPAPVPRVEGVAEAGAWAHSIGFEDGVRLTGIRTPTEIEPGSTFEVSFVVEGGAAGSSARVGAWPPRPASRQVAVGGQGAPPVEVPLDPRVSLTTVELSDGEQTVELSLPAPWHARQVVITLERLDG